MYLKRIQFQCPTLERLQKQLLTNRHTQGGSSEACSRPAEALHIQGFDYEPSLTS